MLLLLAFIGTNIAVVHALPTWESFNSRSSIDSLVTGSTFLLAGGLEYGLSYYLTTPLPKGVCSIGGNMTISVIPHQEDAPLFFVNSGQFFEYRNESYILHVNVLNTTGVKNEPLPYKLALAKHRDGLSNTMWRWRRTSLHLDLDYGQCTNNGFYYRCVSRHGEGLYTSFEP
ncbi:hypothetical protein BGW80DRAFT_1166089 [Lactifluus volemus]|nr:hypothetical protein BGW80DRAFT_1166089 [Lactifluus volemus]